MQSNTTKNIGFNVYILYVDVNYILYICRLYVRAPVLKISITGRELMHFSNCSIYYFIYISQLSYIYKIIF